MASRAEIESEQVYFDKAFERREDQRATLLEAPNGTPVKGHAAGLRKLVIAGVEQLGDPDDAVAFGRFDVDDGTRFYVGRAAIWDTNTEPLVINWKVNGAAPFYEATPDTPMDVVRKRSFMTERNRVLDFEEIVFSQLAEAIETLTTQPAVGDALLAELERMRTGEMRDIVATIQAAQYDVIRADRELLIVEGGPGTGKTAVGLHRLSWLLYNDESLSPDNVAVIGPSRPFIRYVQQVLPALGDARVLHTELSGLLAQPVRVGRIEQPAVLRVKSDSRMKSLLDRSLRARVAVPEEDLEVRSSGGRVRWKARDVEAEVERRRDMPYAEGRQALRDFLRSGAERQRVAIAGDELDRALDRVWPNLTAAQFLQELLGSEARLLRAAGEDFVAQEVLTLHRKSADRITEEVWSEADVPLLDYAQFLINPRAVKSYDHLVVDEAQDLTPLEIDMVKRRSSGGVTLLGDLAQSTGPAARDSWSDVLASFTETAAPADVRDLEYGYRVTKRVFDFAAQLLPAVAPTVTPPTVVRDGPPPELRLTTDERIAATAVQEARQLAGSGHLVAIISPVPRHDAVAEQLRNEGVSFADAREGLLGPTITLLTPEAAKGLEFDGVVVVDPAGFANHEHGGRLLYIALTRTTRHLSVVHLGDPLGGLGVPEATPKVATHGAGRDTRVKAERLDVVATIVTRVAETLGDQLETVVQPEHRLRVVEELRRRFTDEAGAHET